MKYSNLIIRLGLGLLFIWGGLEKIFEGFMGGIGLENAAGFLKSIGLSFLGDTGTFIFAAFLAIVELLVGISVILNKQLKYAYSLMAIIMLFALLLAHIPSGNWMNIMIHITLVCTPLGLALAEFNAPKEKDTYESSKH